MDPYEYIHTLYKKILLRLGNYLDHINTFLDFDDCDFISNQNIATIYSSKKFGLWFRKPWAIDDLMCGLIGEVTHKYVSVYYPTVINGKIHHRLECYDFKDDITGKKLSFCSCDPFDFNYNPGSIGTEKVLMLKCIIEEYIKFYKYQARKNCKISDNAFYLKNCKKYEYDEMCNKAKKHNKKDKKDKKKCKCNNDDSRYKHHCNCDVDSDSCKYDSDKCNFTSDSSSCCSDSSPDCHQKCNKKDKHKEKHKEKEECYDRSVCVYKEYSMGSVFKKQYHKKKKKH